MIVSQPLAILNNSEELFEGRVAQTSVQQDEPLSEVESLIKSGIDWIEGQLTLSF